MKRFFSLGFVLLFVASSGGQLPNDQTSLPALVRQLQAQQKQIVDNQDKIDAKLADLAEAIRVARIYASRGGR